MDCNYTSYVLSKTQRDILVVCLEHERNGIPKILIKDIQNKLKITYRKSNYNVNKLKILEFIDLTKDGNIIFISLSEKAKVYLKNIFGDSQTDAQYVNPFLDRAHKVTLKLPLIEVPDKNLEGFKQVDGRKLNWTANQQTMKFSQQITIQITPRHLIFYFTKVYGIDPHHIVHNCINESVNICASHYPDIKADFPKVVVIEQHHAISNQDVASFTRRYKIHYKSDRLTFDRSISAGEFELIHPEHAQEDFIRLTDFFEAIIRGDISIEDLKEIKPLMPQIKAILENLHNYNKPNIQP